MVGESKSIGTPEEITELTDILVRECGCGCSFHGGKLVRAMPGCFATRALEDRRFLLRVPSVSTFGETGRTSKLVFRRV